MVDSLFVRQTAAAPGVRDRLVELGANIFL
jgi:hypothetical protein